MIKAIINTKSSELVSVGQAELYSTENDIPEGWLECDGSLHSSVVYKELADVCAGIYDSDYRNIGLFRVPNFKSCSQQHYVTDSNN